MTTKLAGQLRHRIKRNDGRGAMIVITGCSIGQRTAHERLVISIYRVLDCPPRLHTIGLIPDCTKFMNAG